MALTQQFKDTMQAAVKNVGSTVFDTLIVNEVNDYKKRLGKTPGFPTMDWKWFKAQVLVESGGPTNSAWKTRPMQIGNPGDPGYKTLKEGKEGADIILSDSLKSDLKSKSISEPNLNVRAGIAYVMVRMASSTFSSTMDDKDTKIYEYVVGPGDSFDVIARKVETTIAVLTQLNPSLKVLHPKDKVKYRKASIQRIITGWAAITAASLAQRYNVGDPAYAEKLTFVKTLLG